MSANTKIEWADHTFNPWIGCTKVSPGCDNCYAKADFDDRKHRVIWGPGQARSRTKTWGDPVKWNAQHAAFFAEHGRRQRVFCASLADVFDNEVDPAWREDLFELIGLTPHLDWLLLTKRIGNAHRMIDITMDAIDRARLHGATELVRGPWPWPNVWLGATIVNQEEADRDIPKLLDVPAAKRFVSMEPLLGPVNLTPINEDRETNEFNALKPDTWEQAIGIWRDTSHTWQADFEDWYGTAVDQASGPMHPAIDWVIVGGESGPGARPMHPGWARSLRDQCEAAGVPFLFKQWGEWAEAGQEPWHAVAIAPDGKRRPCEGSHSMCEALMQKIGKKAAGRILDGRTWDGVPST
jgi:protein gp37